MANVWHLQQLPGTDGVSPAHERRRGKWRGPRYVLRGEDSPRSAASADWPFDMKAGISGPHVGGNMDGKAHHGGRENRQLRMSFAVTEVYTNALLRVSRAGAVIGRSGGAGWSNQNSAGRLVRISGCYVRSPHP